MGAWAEDLSQILSGKETQVQVRVPYKLFADVFYAHRNSLEAQSGLAYHVQRLKGIHALKNGVWPPQRCPAWFIGDDSEWQPLPFDCGFENIERKQLDIEGWRVGYDGITLLQQLTDLDRLRTAHKISVPVVFKTACVLLNSHATGKPNVLFANSQAGRQWPFLHNDIVRYLPNPLTIAGPTFAVVVNKISIDPTETVGSLLTRLESEQQKLTQYSHTPTVDVLAQLDSDDRQTAIEATRQLFNWQPNWRGEALRAATAELKAIQVEGHSDRGLIWHCGMMDTETARLTLQWDGAQLAKADMQSKAEGFMKVLEWLQLPGSWEQSVNAFTW